MTITTAILMTYSLLLLALPLILTSFMLKAERDSLTKVLDSYREEAGELRLKIWEQGEEIKKLTK